MDDRVQAVCEYLTSKNIPWFLGGSRRFGYDNKNSDVDIHILLGPRKDELRLEWDVVYNQDYPIEVWRTTMFGLQVDLIVHSSRVTFEVEEANHLVVESLLGRQPSICDFIKAEGPKKLGRGALIYRTLLRLAKSHHRPPR